MQEFDGTISASQPDQGPRNGQWLRLKVVAVFAASLVIVFVLSSAYVFLRTWRLNATEIERAAQEIATVVAGSVQTFGQTGDMVGLEIFLRNTRESGLLKDVHVVRGPAVAQEFKEREGASPLDELDQKVLESGEAVERLDASQHSIRYIRPSLARQLCLGCHNVPEGTVLGVTSVSVSTETGDKMLASFARGVGVVTLCAILLEVILCFFLLTRIFLKPIGVAVKQLLGETRRLEETADLVAFFSQHLSQATRDQATSVEETTASLDEMASMTRKNAENSMQAHVLIAEAREVIVDGRNAMQRMDEAIAQIQTSAGQSGEIVKTIRQIAFQTNLLALNAAVEAARAGDAGASFAVVASEVRSLAQRSAEAAQKTETLIGESKRNAEHGVAVSSDVGNMLGSIDTRVCHVAGLVEEVATATQRLASGIGNVNSSVSQMEHIMLAEVENAQKAVEVGESLLERSRDLEAIGKSFTHVIGEIRNGRVAH